MIALSPTEQQILAQCLAPLLSQGVALYVFGSRADGTACRGSDLDLALDAGQPLPLMLLAQIQDRLEDSDLPFMVDLVDLHRINPEFRDRITPRLVPLPKMVS